MSGDHARGPGKPPSLALRLWDRIPDDRKDDFIRHAAMDLRRGIHPNMSAGKFLDGLNRTPTSNRALTPGPSPLAGLRGPTPFSRSAASKAAGASSQPPASVQTSSSLPKTGIKGGLKLKKVRVAHDDDETHDVSGLNEESGSVSAQSNRPICRYGLEPPRPGMKPLGALGTAIHRLWGLPGQPGQAAAEAEIMLATLIAADPMTAATDPTALDGFSPDDLAALQQSIRAEAQIVIEDIRQRKAAGDLRLAAWQEPDSTQAQPRTGPGR